MKPRHISAMRQTRGYAIDQQAMNRLQHFRWERRASITGATLGSIGAVALLSAVFAAGQWLASMGVMQ